MNKTKLSLNQVQELVAENKYPVEESKKLLSRCIDGRYENKVKSQKLKVKNTSQKLEGEEQLSPLAFPGGDIGQLAVIIAAANNFGFEIDLEKTYRSLIEVIGGERNFGMHTDSHGDPKKAVSGCGHFKQINLDNQAYSLTKEQVDFIYQKAVEARKAGANEIVLHGDHIEGAVLLVYGNKSVMNQFKIDGSLVEVFMFHQTLANLRNRLLAKKLLENKAVVLVPPLDEDYLYTALCEITEVHLMETAVRLAKDLPIYKVSFSDDGGTEIVEMGVV